MSRIGYELRSWSLGGGRTLNLELPHPYTLTPAEIERLEKYVAALKAEAAISWQAPSNESS